MYVQKRENVSMHNSMNIDELKRRAIETSYSLETSYRDRAIEMPIPVRDKSKGKYSGGEKGRHLWPRLAQNAALSKLLSGALSWNVKSGDKKTN